MTDITSRNVKDFTPKVNEVWITKSKRTVLVVTQIVGPRFELFILWFDTLDMEFRTTKLENQLKEKIGDVGTFDNLLRRMMNE